MTTSNNAFPLVGSITQTLQAGKPVKPAVLKSSEGSMVRANLKRTDVYQTKAMHQLNTIVWKSQKLFDMPMGDFLPAGISTMAFPMNYVDPLKYTITDPIVGSGVVCFGLRLGGGYLFALEATTGELKWRKKLGKGAPVPTIAGDSVYVMDAGEVYSFDLLSGTENWKVKISQEGVFSPAIYDGIIYLGSPDGNMYALDAQDGKTRWTYRAKGQITPAIVSDGTIYFGRQNYLYSLDALTGQEKRKLKVKGAGWLRMLDGTNAYFDSFDGNFSAIDTSTGERKWKAKSSALMIAFMSTAYNSVYFVGDGGNLHSVDAETGKERWKFKTSERCESPVVADQAVYVGCYENLYVVDALTGKQKWKTRKERVLFPSPVVANGILYFVASDGFAYAVQ